MPHIWPLVIGSCLLLWLIMWEFSLLLFLVTVLELAYFLGACIALVTSKLWLSQSMLVTNKSGKKKKVSKLFSNFYSKTRFPIVFSATTQSSLVADPVIVTLFVARSTDTAWTPLTRRRAAWTAFAQPLHVISTLRDSWKHFEQGREEKKERKREKEREIDREREWEIDR